MKTSSADVLARAGNYFFFLPASRLVAELAARTVIAPVFDAGLNMKRPVAALRPSTLRRSLPDFGRWGADRISMH